MIDPSYIQSRDFLDFMDIGTQSHKDCQYWVAEIVQSFINNYVDKIEKGLKEFLKNENKCE